MRRWQTVTLLFVAALVPVPAAAQEPAPARSPLVRADLHGNCGWFNVKSDVPSGYDDWFNRVFYGGAGFGWYWTDHLKTEFEVGATSAAELYSGEPVIISGQPTYLGFRQRFRSRSVAAAQQYQFYRNAWFHPYLAAGVTVSWETLERQDDPLFFYDPLTRQSRTARSAKTHSPVKSVEGRPFAAAGFKAYMTERAFFRTDLRLGMRSGVDEVLLRFGLGVDF